MRVQIPVEIVCNLFPFISYAVFTLISNKEFGVHQGLGLALICWVPVQSSLSGRFFQNIYRNTCIALNQITVALFCAVIWQGSPAAAGGVAAGLTTFQVWFGLIEYFASKNTQTLLDSTPRIIPMIR